ncbi:hypothetical protein MTO96_023944 [Rhipicephalus appendiculatus]
MSMLPEENETGRGLARVARAARVLFVGWRLGGPDVCLRWCPSRSVGDDARSCRPPHQQAWTPIGPPKSPGNRVCRCKYPGVPFVDTGAAETA